jgi:methylase of polypeptide subunit release factors
LLYSDLLYCRQETAASVSHLARLLVQSWRNNPPERSINVLDLCTGTGCIPLLFYHELFNQSDFEPKIGHITGIDISQHALELAEENKTQCFQNVTTRQSSSTNLSLNVLREMQFLKADILAEHSNQSSVMNKLKEAQGARQSTSTYDIMISNPPYISTSAFRRTTSASVRKYEPKLALVPPDPHSSAGQVDEDDGDLFYPKLFDLATMLDTKFVLYEVADMEQAIRVAGLAGDHWEAVEIWRDDPGAGEGEVEFVDVGEGEGRRRVDVRGVGNGRSVVAYRGDGLRWLGRGADN